MRNHLIVASMLFLLAPLSAFAAFDVDLKYGSKGDSVTELQEFLTDQEVYTGPITGNFYALTQSALARFQAQEGIFPAAGYFGSKTRKRVNEMLSTPLSEEDEAPAQNTGTYGVKPEVYVPKTITLPNGSVAEIDNNGKIIKYIFQEPQGPVVIYVQAPSPIPAPQPIPPPVVVPAPVVPTSTPEVQIPAPIPAPTFKIGFFNITNTGVTINSESPVAIQALQLSLSYTYSKTYSLAADVNNYNAPVYYPNIGLYNSSWNFVTPLDLALNDIGYNPQATSPISFTFSVVDVDGKVAKSKPFGWTLNGVFSLNMFRQPHWADSMSF